MITACAVYLLLPGCLRTSQHLCCALNLRGERCEQTTKQTALGDWHLFRAALDTVEEEWAGKQRAKGLWAAAPEKTSAEDVQMSSLID